MKTMKIAALALISVFATSAALAGGDPVKGKAAYGVCASCHGADGTGNKALNAPAVAGQGAWYVARQLKNFKTGVRGSSPKDSFGMQMRPMAMTLVNDAAVADISAYIAKMSPKKAHDAKGDVAKGKAAYGVCAACHGANGKGVQALNGPNLTIQQAWYIKRQLKNFKAGIRGSHPKDTFGATMKPMAMTLADDAAINNVVAYIQSLK